jgi:hypothetical protein
MFVEAQKVEVQRDELDLKGSPKVLSDVVLGRPRWG